MNVDLPNLASINSGGFSFYHPLSVTLESISESWILIVFRYSKSPKCQTTWWSVWSSIPESSIEINFEYCVDWFDFIHRCSFHSRWSCRNQAAYHVWWSVLLSIMGPTRHNPSITIQWSLNIQCLLCLFQNPYHHSLVIDLGSNHHLTRFHHHNPDWFS